MSPKDKATGAINTHDLNLATGDSQSKAFATLASQYALAGHALNRTDPKDGPVSYYAERWGQVRELRNLAEVAAFLDQVGGPHA